MTRESAREILGIPSGATDAEIKAQYRLLARQRHPDVAGGSESAMVELTAAYDLLRGKTLSPVQMAQARRDLARVKFQLDIVRARMATWSEDDYRREELLGPLLKEQAAIEARLT